jgi:hypothetical protein
MRNDVSERELINHAKATGGERVTLSDIEGAIVHEAYFTAADGVLGNTRRLASSFVKIDRTYIPTGLGLLTICVLTLWNGYTILGKSACADPKNFDAELGKRLARTDAVNQIWPLMGYELKSRMARDQRLIGGAPVTPHAGSTTYIGTKAVAAMPMTRLTYNVLRGWKVPADENPHDEGYLVEYLDSPEKNVEGFNGYVSWSPAEVFERAYRPVRQAEAQPSAASETVDR